MKKITSFLLVATLGLSLMLSGCGGNTSGTKPASSPAQAKEDTSIDDIKVKGKFILGLDATFAPMGFTDEAGNILGFDIDLAKEVAKKMGVEVELKPIDWDSKSMELSSKKIDVIWNGFSITDERKKEVLFSTPYLTTEQVLVVKKGSSVKTKADLKGKKIALQDGSTSEDALKADKATYEAIGDSNISRFKENTQVLMELSSGRVDAAIIDEVFVHYYLTKEKMADKYEVLNETFGGEDYGVGGRLEDKLFMAAIDKALKECKDEGITSKISQKWFGEDIIKK